MHSRLPLQRTTPLPAVVPTRAIPLWRWVAALVASVGYAWQGLVYLIRTQRNAQIHIAASVAVVSAGFVFRLDRWEWIALVFAIALVLAAEAMNTAVENAVDVATASYHPLAKIAKDVAASAVLLCALASLVVGAIIFWPHVMKLLM